MSAPVAVDVNRGRASRRWLAASLAVAAAGLATRIHDIYAFAPLHDFDGPGHGVNVLALERGELPDPQGWGGFHPPLYYAIGAAVWRILPERVPVHVGLRAISVVAGVVLAIVLWRALRRFVADADAAVTAALVFCSPVFTIASSMLGNEMLGASFVTIALMRLTAIPPQGPLAGHAAATGVWLALGLWTKSSALAAVAAAALGYALAGRGRRSQAFAAAALVVVLPLAAASAHYVRLMRASGGSLLSVVSGAAMAPQVQEEMRAQPPGERHVGDYVRLPLSAFLAPHFSAPGLARSVPGLLHASAWADGHGEFLPADVPGVLSAASVLSCLGIVPALVALFGLVRLLRRPERYRAATAPLVFGALLVAALVRYTWVLPFYSAVKASYLLPAALPAALLLAVGIGGLSPGRRDALRGFCLVLALLASGVLWQGWWE